MSKPQEDGPQEEFEGQAKGDYEVGYGKPPKDHQFQPNNKLGKGRKTGSKNTKTIVKEAFGQKVSATVGGKTKKMTKIELAMLQLANKASAGDLKAIEKVIQLQERYGPQEDPEGPDPAKVGHDLDALRDYLAMMDQIHPPDEEGGND